MYKGRYLFMGIDYDDPESLRYFMVFNVEKLGLRRVYNPLKL